MARRSAGEDIGTTAASSNNMEVLEVSTPETVVAGRPIPVSIALQNNAELVFPTDPDYCISGVKAGQKVVATASAQGGETAQSSVCIPAFGGQRSLSLQVPGPSSGGQYNINVAAMGANSEEPILSQTATVRVQGDSDGGDDAPPVPPGQDQPDGGNGDGDTPSSLSGYWRSLGDREKALVALGGAGAIYALSRSQGE